MRGGQDCEKAGFMSSRPLQPWCFKGKSTGISHVTERGNARISHVTDTGNAAGIASERTYGWSRIKGVSGACTWGGQPPGTPRIAQHPAYLDTPVLEPQIGAGCAFARLVGSFESCLAGVLRIGCAIDHIEVAYQSTARRAEPESHQPRAIGDHESDLSCQDVRLRWSSAQKRATAEAGPVCPADPRRHDRVRITILCPVTQSRYASHDCIGAVHPQAESACARRFSPAATSTPRP